MITNLTQALALLAFLLGTGVALIGYAWNLDPRGMPGKVCMGLMIIGLILTFAWALSPSEPCA